MSKLMNHQETATALNAASRAAAEHVPDGYGVCLIIAPVNVDLSNGGDFASNMKREGVIKLLRQTADRIERNMKQSN